jgi:hypothetical protein
MTIKQCIALVLCSTNFLMTLTEEMEELLKRVQSILKTYDYLVPFLTQEWNHLQFSINGGKGVSSSRNTCTIIQTGMHCDIMRCIQCLPISNSQAINSIVAIITVGDSRILTMERVEWSDGPTNHVLETQYFILSHNSLFLLHPMDERPTRRDSGSTRLSYWRHGAVRLACSTQECNDCCDEKCQAMNQNIVSFALAFRRCSHTRIIDPITNVEPLSDDIRSKLKLPKLNETEKERNTHASNMLKEYCSEKFDEWLYSATKHVRKQYYNK